MSVQEEPLSQETVLAVVEGDGLVASEGDGVADGEGAFGDGGDAGDVVAILDGGEEGLEGGDVGVHLVAEGLEGGDTVFEVVDTALEFVVAATGEDEGHAHEGGSQQAAQRCRMVGHVFHSCVFCPPRPGEAFHLYEESVGLVTYLKK